MKFDSMSAPVIEECVSQTPQAATALAQEPAPDPSWFDAAAPGASWNRTIWIALFALAALWAVRLYTTWATWGSLTVDCGREMYVPAMLAEGKMLYRDLWYPHGPLAPYLNSVLFSWFGPHLNVLYWAGALAALGSALVLYLVGLRFSSWMAGWTAGAIVLMQAFQPGIFSFPLAYSFASVYGCLAACVFLWLAVCGVTSRSRVWVAGAGTVAAIALLSKLEMGAACYAALVLVIVGRGVQQRSWRSVVGDAAAILPGVAVCGAVLGWMVSIAGADFITQENFMSWPSSFFMRTYGKMWLASTGMSISGAAIGGAVLRTALVAGVAVLFHRFLRRRPFDDRKVFLLAGLGVAALAFQVSFLSQEWERVFRMVFFPQDMVLYVAIAAVAAGLRFWRQPGAERASLALLLAFSSLLGSRMLLGMVPSSYSIYYNGPIVLSFLLLAGTIIPRAAHSRDFVFQGKVFLCFACLVAVILHTSQMRPFRRDLVALTTERGMIRVLPSQARNYQAAIAFMKEKAARRESVLSLPEDTSLYFLAGTQSPTRVLAFTPGVVAPGKMTAEVIREIERADVRYLLWSNRTFQEYGVPTFGKDFDRPLGDYLRSHYQHIGTVGPLGTFWEWNAGIWERKPVEGRP
jgi:hypothetical protein